MPKGYHHLTYEQRCQIPGLLKRGITQSQIAEDLKVSQSTISREIHRNGSPKEYDLKQADAKAVSRRREANSKRSKITLDIWMYVEKMLKDYQWSPEQISGYMSRQYNVSVSHVSIYSYIRKDKYNKGTLYKNLRHKGKKYNRGALKSSGRGLISNRLDIDHRPLIVELKKRFGDVEIDTIRGPRHSLGAIVSIADRKTKLTFLVPIPRATAEHTKKAIVAVLEPIKKHIFTLTADNGKEFAQHLAITQELNAPIFFAHPYCSWQRGLNEHTNGLVRQYFPKGMDLSKLTLEEVKHVEHLLNTRPRKVLGYKTPIEAFQEATNVSLYDFFETRHLRTIAPFLKGVG